MAETVNLDEVTLPAGVHAVILRARDVVTGGPLAEVIIWADRDDDECPRCGEPVPRVMEECPAHLNAGAGQGGAIEPWDQTHGCGEWLSVAWSHVGDAEYLSAGDVEQAADDLAAEMTEEG